MTYPICLHAHKICNPLLANFPKKRIDINPYHDTIQSALGWGVYRLETLVKNYGDLHPILLFLDSFTVNNLKIEDLNEYTGDVYLFVGDTQHGPHTGFSKLLDISRAACVKKIYFVNNPQHAHWFVTKKSNLSEMYYVPIGFSNYEKTSTWESKYVRDKVVHIGNQLNNHVYRSNVLRSLKSRPLDFIALTTDSYKKSNAIYSKSLASLNISLNSDLSFRISEVLVSNGVCITDSLGYIQNDNFSDFKHNVYEFSELSELIYMIKNCDDLLHSSRSFHFDSFSSRKLDSLDDLAYFQRPIKDSRVRFWNKPGGARIDSLQTYLNTRDYCITACYPTASVVVNNNEDLDILLDMVDLSRLKLNVRASKIFVSTVSKIAGMYPNNVKFRGVYEY